jgi:hypothetical protein
LVQKQRGDLPGAAQSFEKYLSSAPEAADAALIHHYMTELTP